MLPNTLPQQKRNNLYFSFEKGMVINHSFFCPNHIMLPKTLPQQKRNNLYFNFERGMAIDHSFFLSKPYYVAKNATTAEAK